MYKQQAFLSRPLFRGVLLMSRISFSAAHFIEARLFRIIRCFCLGAALFVGLALAFFITPVRVAYAASCAGGVIPGTVFRDYNANGVNESGDPGVAGIVVTAYWANVLSATCETTANGAYGIDPAGGFPVRLEFTL